LYLIMICSQGHVTILIVSQNGHYLELGLNPQNKLLTQ
jgi:hypothetical protein